MPIREGLDEHGVHGIVVKEERHLPRTSGEPSSKVDSYLQAADAFVALCTPDDELAGGTFRVRPNIISEIERARARPKLQNLILVLKASNVELEASNLNPVYEDLDIDDPRAATDLILDQLRVWEVLPVEAKPAATPGETAPTVTELIDRLQLGDHDEATRRVYHLLLSRNRQALSETVEKLRDFLLSTSSEQGDVSHVSPSAAP